MPSRPWATLTDAEVLNIEGLKRRKAERAAFVVGFVGFSGVLAWGREDELTTRVLDDYEQMVSESGDYFETCGELTIAVEDHETFTRWFDAMRPWCRATRALDGLIWQLCEGDWSAK